PKPHISKPSAREYGKKWSATPPCSASARTSAFMAALLKLPMVLFTPSAPSASSISPSRNRPFLARPIGGRSPGIGPGGDFHLLDFISCAFNQIVNMLAKSHYRWNAPSPLVLRGPSGGGVHGGPFHSQNPEMWFVHTPGLKVVCPGTAYDAKGLIKAAIRDN